MVPLYACQTMRSQDMPLRMHACQQVELLLTLAVLPDADLVWEAGLSAK